MPEEGSNPKYAQLYSYDTSNEVQNRMGYMKLGGKDVDRLLIESLLTMLDSSSAVAKAFRMARDWAQCNEGQKGNKKRLHHNEGIQCLHDIRENEIFGPTNAGFLVVVYKIKFKFTAVYTIEFQKRGLPHAHMLLWLRDESKAITANDIDDIISVEFPSQESDPEGHKAVVQHMVHGPCGDDNKKAPCMSDGKCTKHFPKPYYAETTVDEDGYIHT
ncbi:hypothetical protein V2J09_021316 [Rumex salicifolius]